MPPSLPGGEVRPQDCVLASGVGAEAAHAAAGLARGTPLRTPRPLLWLCWRMLAPG